MLFVSNLFSFLLLFLLAAWVLAILFIVLLILKTPDFYQCIHTYGFLFFFFSLSENPVFCWQGALLDFKSELFPPT